MEIWNLVLLVVELWVASLLVFVLHAFSPRIGISALLMYTAAIVGILTYADPATLFVEPFAGIILTLPSDVFVPIVILVVLVLYVADGTEIAQIVILGIALIQVLVGLIFTLVSAHTYLPGAEAAIGTVVFTDLLQVNYQLMAAGVITFIVDMFVVSIIYQGVANTFGTKYRGLGITFALLGALWTDAIVFNALAAVGSGGFAAFLPGDVISKTIAAFAIAPLAVVYLSRFAPSITHVTPNRERPTFDIFHNIFGNLRERVAVLENELNESDTNFRQLVGSVQEIMWIAEARDDWAYFVSPALQDILGMSRSEYYLEPELARQMIHPDDRAIADSKWLQAVPATHDIEFRVICRDGKTRWLRDRAYPIVDKGSGVGRTIGITEDITLKRQQQSIQTAIQVEQEKAKLLHSLIDDMSHDLRTPLGAIGLKVELLKRVTDPEKQANYMKELQQQTQYLAQMLDHMFTMLRLEAGEDMPMEVIPITELLNPVMMAMETLAKKEDVKLVSHIDLPTGKTINCQPNELSRALTNIIGNGVHYTAQGSKVTVRVNIAEKWLYIRVRDRGIGIPPEDLPHIFDRFYRGSNAPANGSGLGLAIAKRVIERHSGILSVESVLSEGTTFTITLPVG